MSAISISDIVMIHDRVVTEIGGALGVREPGLLAAVAEKPHASFGGTELYLTIYDKAAALFEALVNYHVFVDGNKRTAIAVLEFYLFRNNLRLNASAELKEKFVLDTAANNPDLADVAAWIEQHSLSST